MVMVDVDLIDDGVEVSIGQLLPQKVLEVRHRDESGIVRVDEIKGFRNALFLDLTVRLHGGGQEFGVMNFACSVYIDGMEHVLQFDVAVLIIGECLLEFVDGDAAILGGVDLSEDLPQESYLLVRRFVRDDEQGQLLQSSVAREALYRRLNTIEGQAFRHPAAALVHVLHILLQPWQVQDLYRCGAVGGIEFEQLVDELLGGQ
mmetsp:Transcript_13783/g.37885  ORF Transcript_13783/g.37885 Transcript_13783/m.37885 type:complete len:203 (-) Transcript_13783:280-888(-)